MYVIKFKNDAMLLRGEGDKGNVTVSKIALGSSHKENVRGMKCFENKFVGV